MPSKVPCEACSGAHQREPHLRLCPNCNAVRCPVLQDWSAYVIKAVVITDEVVEQVEGEVGMGRGAWDMVDPKDLIAAAFRVLRDRLEAAPAERAIERAVADGPHG